MLWSGLAFPLAFLVLGTRRGLLACVGIYAAFVLLTVPPIVAGVPADAPVNSVSIHVSLAVHCFVMIVLLRALASRLEALATARAAAKLFASQAGTDTLTGLPNRRQLDDELARYTAGAHRHQEPLSVLLVDIDHFKAVDDRHGHQAGDRVLRELALRSPTRFEVVMLPDAGVVRSSC